MHFNTTPIHKIRQKFIGKLCYHHGLQTWFKEGSDLQLKNFDTSYINKDI